jgi:hypothetical protein
VRRNRTPTGSVAPLLVGLLLVVVGLLVTLAPRAEGSTAADDERSTTLILYWGDGCPKCAAEKEFLAEFSEGHPGLEVETYEVYREESNRDRFARHAQELGIEANAVPTTVLDERVWIGFTPAIEDDLRSTLADALAGDPVPAGVYGNAAKGTCTDVVCEVEEDPPVEVDVPMVGQVEVSDHSLVLSTLVIGFVDGINPCSLWVISILLMIVIRTGSRRRVLAIGSTFLVVTAGMYALFMAGIYGVLSVIGYLGAIQLAVAVAAGIFGVVSVKDYFLPKKGLSFTIPDSSKPSLYARMRTVAGQKALVPALAATAALAVGVSLLETPCTAGFPVLWTGLLEANDVPFAESALLFLLYMVPFLVDEFIVFGAAVVTMRATHMQERHGRVLKLVAGTTMLALAGTMALAPEVMESVSGATLVFVGAGVAAAVTHLVTRRVQARRVGRAPVKATPIR